VLKKPIDVPIKFEGVKSHIKGEVDEMTMEKPKHIDGYSKKGTN
jgi:hypothetical protein